MSVIKKYGFCALLVLFCFGCAQKDRPRILFPPPPEVSRLEFIGVYASENDFEKTPFQEFTEGILGSSALAKFKSPYGVVSDGEGKVYVSDIHWRNLRVYDFNARTVEFYLPKSVFTTPADLALDSQGRLYVVDAEKGKVFVFAPDRKALFTFGTPEDVTRPAYLTINEKLERIYVSDGQSHRVVVYDLSGNHLFSFGQRGGGKGSFYAPQGLAFGPDGNLYVADQFNTLVQVFDPDGKFVRQFGERGDQVFQFESPKDVAFDSDGNLYVVDARRGHVLTYTPEGRLLLATGGKGLTSTPLGFSTPRSIFIDQNDRIYVTDMLNKRFSIWQYLSEAYLQKQPVTEEDRARLEQLLKEK